MSWHHRNIHILRKPDIPCGKPGWYDDEGDDLVVWLNHDLGIDDAFQVLADLSDAAGRRSWWKIDNPPSVHILRASAHQLPHGKPVHFSVDDNTVVVLVQSSLNLDQALAEYCAEAERVVQWQRGPNGRWTARLNLDGPAD